MVNKKQCIYVNLENELLKDMIENISKQLVSLHMEVFEMLTDCRNLQHQIFINKAPDLEIIDKVDITNDIIQL